jgi:hypothetical protein
MRSGSRRPADATLTLRSFEIPLAESAANSLSFLPRGRSSVVERQLPKLYVEGSIPFARSKIANDDNYLSAYH